MIVLNTATLTPKNNQIYIGRGTPYGNPFPIKNYRHDRNLVVALHEQYFIKNLLTSKSFCDELGKLNKYTDVVCHCSPEKCHGDIIKEYVDLRDEYGEVEATRILARKKGYIHLPLLDGETHINIYSKGHTKLGRMLSHFTESPFEHEEFGKFRSVEGFWFYVKSGMKHDELRTLHGFEAKKVGSTLSRVECANFMTLIEQANECKIRQNPEILEEFTKNHKPFLHYYSYGEPWHAVVRQLGPELPMMFNNIRNRITPSYKTIIAGSRDFCDLSLFAKEMGSLTWNIDTVIDGVAKGADLLGCLFAKAHGYNHLPFKADWDNKGNAAGILRNGEMEKAAEKAIVFHKNNSSGSLDMIERMKKANKEVKVVVC